MVLVCHPYQFIYIKTRKTASTSLEVFFEPHCLPGDVPQEMGRPAVHSDNGIVGARTSELNPSISDEQLWIGHMRAADVARELPEAFAQYFKFTSVRHPYSRAFSCFLYRAKESLRQSTASLKKIRRSFDVFMNTIYARDFDDRDTVHVNRAYPFDDTIRYETLIADIRRIYDHLRLPRGEYVLPRLRDTSDLSARIPLTDIITRAHADIIRTVDGWVFERFDYDDAWPPRSRAVA